jgi:hypothetical protein
MRWYIAEERDSGQLLRDAYQCVRDRASGTMSNGHSNGLSTDAQAIIACMTDGFGKLEKQMKTLKRA